VPELIDHGRTGFIVIDRRGSRGRALRQDLDRRQCRETFEQRFTADRMARDYVAVYDGLLAPVRRRHEESQRERPRRGSEPALHRRERERGTIGPAS
jgi:hypothetical protein